MNTDWQRLKVSSSGIPKWDSFTPYILEVLKNGEEKTKGVIIIRVLVFLGILEELRSQEHQIMKVLNLFYTSE
ncbi:hypothetical protein [Aerococcus urinaeequi]|uniref:hypothetical protein n=1 Tax=Aerococcus urinaeequi TaxID=51665 RepID=UPI003D6B5070